MRIIMLCAPLILGFLLSWTSTACASLALQDPAGISLSDSITLIVSQGIGIMLVVWFIWPKSGGWAQMMDVLKDNARVQHEDMGKVFNRLDAIAADTASTRQITGNVQTQLSTRPCVVDQEHR